MLSRGFDGAMPCAEDGAPSRPAVARGPGPRRGSRWRWRRSAGAWRDGSLPRRPPPPPVSAAVAPPSLDVAGLTYAYPTGTRPCTGSTCAPGPASGSRCSDPTGRARRRWCCTSTASSGRRRTRRRGRAPGGARRTCRRSAAGSGSSSRTPTTSCSCRPSATTSRSARPTSASRAALRPGRRRAGRRRDARLPRPLPLHLSIGQRRRVALATVLACHPEILVLDEPSSNLDPVARRELADVLLTLGRGGAPACSWSPTTCPMRCSCARAASSSTTVSWSPTGPTRDLLADPSCWPATASSCRSGSRSTR